jgi:hypothetical protein
VAGEGKQSHARSWYFVRLAFLAIPWDSRKHRRPKGNLFKQYHLLQADDIGSAFRKAEHILSASENLSGDGKLNGIRVIYRKIGILDLEPLYQKLESGVELFDESELNVSCADIESHVLSKSQRLRMVAYEKKKGKQPPLDVYWGGGFNRI